MMNSQGASWDRPEPIQRWEYKEVHVFASRIEEALSDLGKAGWEVFHAHYYTDIYRTTVGGVSADSVRVVEGEVMYCRCLLKRKLVSRMEESGG